MASVVGRLLQNIGRSNNASKLCGAYRYSSSLIDKAIDGGSSTTVTFLSKEEDGGIFFEAFSPHGFRLSNGLRAIGPCAVFPKSILHWSVSGINDVDEDSLSLFTILEPKLDILVLGVGERENLSKINPAVIQYLRSKRINVEVLTTDQALATFNFLNSEKRYVAGAFIPPTFIESYGDEDELTFASMAESGSIDSVGGIFEDTTSGEFIGNRAGVINPIQEARKRIENAKESRRKWSEEDMKKGDKD